MLKLMEQMPSLWSDWCAVVGVNPENLDKHTIRRFQRMAQPSQAVLAQLRIQHTKPKRIAPTWPQTLRDNEQALTRVLRSGTASVQLAGSDWQHRVRLRRMLAVAVLIAPVDAGGAALSRAEITELRPPRMSALRQQLATDPEPACCPRCAIWSWLQVVGMNRHWSRAAVREHESFPDRLEVGMHRHELEDPEPDWALWNEEASLMPAMDQWGYLELHTSLHPSSLSVVIAQIADLGMRPAPKQIPMHPARPPAAADEPRITAQREREILAEADALEARMRRLFEAMR